MAVFACIARNKCWENSHILNLKKKFIWNELCETRCDIHTQRCYVVQNGVRRVLPDQWHSTLCFATFSPPTGPIQSKYFWHHKSRIISRSVLLGFGKSWKATYDYLPQNMFLILEYAQQYSRDCDLSSGAFKINVRSNYVLQNFLPLLPNTFQPKNVLS